MITIFFFIAIAFPVIIVLRWRSSHLKETFQQITFTLELRLKSDVIVLWDIIVVLKVDFHTWKRRGEPDWTSKNPQTDCWHWPYSGFHHNCHHQQESISGNLIARSKQWFLNFKVELPSRVYMIFDDKEYHGYSNETIVARYYVVATHLTSITFWTN